MKKFVRASLLILALSCTAYAGNMPYPVIDPQPTPTPEQMSRQESTVSDVQEEQNGTESAATEAVIDLISTVLTLF